MKKFLISLMILFIGFQLTVKCFNHFTPLLSIVPIVLTVLPIYFMLTKSKKENEK